MVATVWLAKVRDDGDRADDPPPPEEGTPEPARPTACGVPLALSETRSWPVKVPVMVGLKVTLMLQGAPAARDDPQLLEAAKLLLAATPEILSAVLPVLVSVTV